MPAEKGCGHCKPGYVTHHARNIAMWMRAARPRLASWESGYERGADGGGELTGPSLMDLQWDGPGILDIADIEGAQSPLTRLAVGAALVSADESINCRHLLLSRCSESPALGWLHTAVTHARQGFGLKLHRDVRRGSELRF